METVITTLEITIKQGDVVRPTLRFTSFPIDIGRDPANAIALDDANASRTHTRIKKRGRLVIIEDLNSKNGTYVNGDRIVNKVLRSGDRILVGDTELYATIIADISIAQIEADTDAITGSEPASEIALITPGQEEHLVPSFFAQNELINRFSPKTKHIKDLFTLHGNVVACTTFEEATNAVLRSVQQICPSLTRAAVFTLPYPHTKLKLVNVKKFSGALEQPFAFNHALFSESIAKKQGLLTELPLNKKLGPRFLLIFPILHGKDLFAILHLEAEKVKKHVLEAHVVLLQLFLERCAANLQTLLLRGEMDSLMLGMVEAMVATIEAKDTYTVGHSERVCRYSMAIADELQLDRETKKLLMISSLCHDIGKIGIPDSILKKSSFLSAEEYEEMKLHPVIGANIVSYIPNAERFISGVKHHHEKWDGTGYPDGLIGEEIPFFGRIVAVADVFDAMISGRSYSGFIDESDAIEKIVKESELFDPDIVRALVRAWENGTITQRTSTITNATKVTKKS